MVLLQCNDRINRGTPLSPLNLGDIYSGIDHKLCESPAPVGFSTEPALTSFESCVVIYRFPSKLGLRGEGLLGGQSDVMASLRNSFLAPMVMCD